MCWLKRNLWKTGIAIAGMLLLLVLMVLVPVSATGAQERVLGFTGMIAATVQATPTVDTTVTALNKEKLAQEVQQLKNQNEPDLLGWLRTNASILLSTLVLVIGGLVGLFRWLGDRRSEREKRAEERFQSAVAGFGDDKEGARIGAAILLRTFLRPGYEQFYTQTFDLAVANLRLPRTPNPPQDPTTPLPLTTLSQALVVVFKEAFPLAREWIKKRRALKSSFLQRIKARLKRIEQRFDPQSLSATGIQLDNAYLAGADLKQASMQGASMQKVDLTWANLFKADLSGADLSGAKLDGANLSEASLWEANLSDARLSDTNLEEAIFKDTNLHDVKGLTKEQLATCKTKGAIVDEDTTISSSQATVSPPLPTQSNGVQAPSIPSVQGSIPALKTDGNSTTSSQQSDNAKEQSVPSSQESAPTSGADGNSTTSS